ncbi:TnpX site-specific recombinase, partial [human gut metagenome]
CENLFRDKLGAKRKEDFKKELAAKRRQITQAQRRMEELDRLFKRLYEDNISGKINDSRFEKLSADYENEQAELTEKMQLLEQEITQQEKEADSIEQFILRAKKYPNLQELTPAVLHDLVSRVYVSAPDKSSGQRSAGCAYQPCLHWFPAGEHHCRNAHSCIKKQNSVTSATLFSLKL